MAVIGCGPIGELHAEAIAAVDRTRRWWRCAIPMPQRRQSAARALWRRGLRRAWRELLAQATLDAVTIATPDHLHVEPALAAIAGGLPRVLRKAAGHERQPRRERMVEARRARGVQLAVDYNRRFALWLSHGQATARRRRDRRAGVCRAARERSHAAGRRGPPCRT